MNATQSRVRRCPRCRSGDVCRSKRRRLERLLSLLFVLPYRCLQCGNRFRRLDVFK